MIAPQRMQHVSSGGLALLVHGMLLLGLMVGVSWKNPPHLPIEADIWTDLPAPPPPIIPPALAAQPEPPPKAAPAPPDQAQIALEKAEKKRVEQHQAELQRQTEKVLAEKKQAEDKRAEELRRAEQDRADKQRVEKEQAEKAEKEKRDQSRRLLDQDLARQMREDLDAEGSQLRALQDRAKAGKQTRVVRDFQERIRAKIRDALVLPQSLKGDAEVIFQVSLLPNGEVARVALLRTSGQPLYDGAVERAIYKASPLPLPTERDAAAQFREGLTLKFRPSADAVGLH